MDGLGLFKSSQVSKNRHGYRFIMLSPTNLNINLGKYRWTHIQLHKATHRDILHLFIDKFSLGSKRDYWNTWVKEA